MIIRTVIAYIILLLYILWNNYIIRSSLAKYALLFITPLTLLVVSFFFFLVFPKVQRRIRYKYEKIQNIIIILFIYSIIYFLSGLIFGYEYSIYGRDIFTVIKNLYAYLSFVILTEYMRNKLVFNTENNIINNVLISLIFAFISINFTQFINNLSSFSIGFKYMATIIIPSVITSFVLTYITRHVGLLATILYNGWLKLMLIILPIFPSLPWIITAILGILLSMFVYFNINCFEMMYDRKERRFYLNKDSKIVPVISIFTIILIIFILKGFKYFPIAVLSDSMKPLFSRGDTVIIEKINEKSLKEMKAYDIIYYKKNNRYIVHRIEKIETVDGRMIITTKGDNNDNIDSWKVYEEDIIGIMRVKVPYIGYPAVWLNEALNT